MTTTDDTTIVPPADIETARRDLSWELADIEVAIGNRDW